MQPPPPTAQHLVRTTSEKIDMDWDDYDDGENGSAPQMSFPPLQGLIYVMPSPSLSGHVEIQPSSSEILVPLTPCPPSTPEEEALPCPFSTPEEKDSPSQKLEEADDVFELELSDEARKYSIETIAKGTKCSNIVAMNAFSRFWVSLIQSDESKHMRFMNYIGGEC